MQLVAGTRLGPYEIHSALGAGGMGEVYRARDTRLERDVAVKVLPADVAAHADRLRRFEQEARAASALNHPNILTIFDVGSIESPRASTFVRPEPVEGRTPPPMGPLHYIVTELIDGETLRRWMLRTPRPALDEVLEVAIQIASALAAAHRAGIVHRDIKPENVMVRRDGYVKVLDFGLARLAEYGLAADARTVAGHTAPGFVVGTTKYMSPEQARGLAVDGRSDIFSLGVVLYELLAGRAPFDGATATDALLAVIEREPAPLSTYREDASADLQRIVTRCLAKDVAQRYDSAERLLADLKNVRTSSAADRAAAQAAPSIAVLPFVNMSADAENEFFCDGLAEELMSALSKIDRLHVAARTSTFSFKGKGLDVREIGRALNVGAVLEGSVRKAGTRIRITTQLVNVADGYHLWSDRYDRQLEDIFQIQDEIALAIVGALKVKLLVDEKAAIAKRQTVNVEAYQLYLKGRHHWHKWTEEGFRKAKECLERAIQIDPDYALAYFGLADVFAAGSAVAWPPHEMYPKAKAAVTRALALDEGLAEAWTLIGVCHLIYDWDWPAARAALARAIELNPRLGHAYAVLAQYELFTGRPDDAVATARHAVELDPLAPFWNYILAENYWARGEYDRALDQLQALREIDPTSWFAYFGRGIVVGALGRREEAVEAFEEAVRCSGGNPYAIGYLACACALAGQRDRAERHLAELIDGARHRWVPALSIAVAYLGLDQTDRVFEWLERAYEERDGWLLWQAYDPTFQSVRSDPRMTDLLRRVGLPNADPGTRKTD